MSGAAFAGGLLLDTCALIWLANGDPLPPAARRAIDHALLHDGVLVSPISAWEIGLLSCRKSGPWAAFAADPERWLGDFMTAPGIQPAPFTAEMALAASYLPEPLHRDPADRLLIATARRLGLPLVTRDERILAYGRTGHVAVVAC